MVGARRQGVIRTGGLIVVLLLGMVACRVPESIDPDPAKVFADARPETLSKRLAENPPTSVAVLPFTQEKGEELGAEVVRRSFFNHLSSKKFKDVELYRVDTLLRAQGITTAEEAAKKTPQELARILQVDALVYGHVSDYGRMIAATVSQVVVGLSATMVDGRDGSVLWKITKTSRQVGGSIPLSPIGLAMGAINAALNIRAVELLRGADDVCRKIVATLPGPTLSDALRPPALVALAQDSGGQPKKAGDVIKVSIVGDPGHQATFSIGTYKTNIPMVEVKGAPPQQGADAQASKTATYVGSYQVRPGDNVDSVLIEGRLTDERGNQGRWVDVLSSVTLDTQPPAVPSGLEVVGRDTAVVVRWQSNPDQDLAGYQVYRSASPLSGYQVVQRVEVTEVRDSDLTNLTRYYYKIAAVDRAGNVSPPSEYVSGMPIKPGPTPVTADITDDTKWYLGSSPYVLQTPVTIRPGVTLSIDAGVTIESSGPGLRVRGRLLAVGTDEAPIVFRARRDGGEANGSWDGIVFDNTGSRENRIEHAKVQDAKTALHMISSSPDIRHTLLIKNNTACLVEDLSKPQLEANTIRDNRQDGLVSRHATPTVVHNEITHNGRHGIVVVASAPVLTENNIHSNAEMQLAIEGENAEIVNAQNNWWGTVDRGTLAQKIAGPASYAKVLDRPYPEGQLIAVRVQQAAGERQQTATESLPVVRASQSVDELVVQGKAALAQRRLPEALQLFSQAVVLQPENDQLQFQLGIVQYQLGELEATLSALQKAIALQPRQSEYHYHLGLVYSELGQSKQAISAWQQVLTIDPTHRNAGMLLKLEQRQAGSQ
jgi:Flp pilus assembly protein TadD